MHAWMTQSVLHPILPGNFVGEKREGKYIDSVKWVVHVFIAYKFHWSRILNFVKVLECY